MRMPPATCAAPRPDDQPRIKAELDELTEQIKRQEEIVRNPKAAEEKTEKNIQSGLERERQPEKPVAGKTVNAALSIHRQGLRRIIFKIVSLKQNKSQTSSITTRNA